MCLATKHETEDTVSFVDVLEREQELEENANAVLGACDDKNCSYSLGYVPRQALYSCATCQQSNPTAGGFCLACCLHCHRDHDLYELYTKRNFRCDCGNSLFPDNKCKLEPVKDPLNANNVYGQNFVGKYCVCSRPYPDPDDTDEDVMIQCIICEDWFHSKHLEVPQPEDSEDYEEMICSGCVERCSFLRVYDLACRAEKVVPASTVGDTVSEKGAVSVVLGSADCSDAGPSYQSTEGYNHGKAGPNHYSHGPKGVSVEPSHPGAADANAKTSEGSKQEGSGSSGNSGNVAHTECSSDVTAKVAECRLAALIHSHPPSFTEHTHGALFMPANWRAKLCLCTHCQEMYGDKRVSFLLDAGDSISAYEARGSEGATSAVDSGMTALASLHRIQQVELINGYNEMKSELVDYLKKFADNKKTVREEDIREFFSQMEARKKQKSSEGFQYHCK